MSMKKWVVLLFCMLFAFFAHPRSGFSGANLFERNIVWGEQGNGQTEIPPLLRVAQASTESASADEAPQLDRQAFPIQPPSIQRILDRGKLIVAQYHRDVPPFYFHNKEGEYTGVDVEMMRGFARLLNVDIEFHRKSKAFDQVVKTVANREADVACSKLGLTFKRATWARYTEPYILLHQGLLINRLELQKQRRGRPREVTIQNLEGRLGVIAKSSYVDNGRERFKKAEIVGYPTWDGVLEAVAKGEVVAAYRDEVEIKQIIRDRPDFALRFLTVVLKDAKDPKAMIVAWDSHTLLALLNMYTQYLDLNLTANRVLDEYDDVIATIKKKTTIKKKQ